MAQKREQYSDSECGSKVDSSEYESEFEYESSNDPKRIKISECESESEFESDSYSDNDDSEVKQIEETCETDKKGHIICHPRQKIGEYEFKSILGEGAFGRVIKVKCASGLTAAMKVLKNEISKRKSAMTEIITLTKIECRDTHSKSLCIKMLKWFEYGGHICIVFPLMGISVLDFLKNNNYEPFSVNNIRHIGYQMCTAVAFLHSNGMSHTDIKPDNVLFVNSSYTTIYDEQQKKAVKHPICTDIRLIDFGNVTRDEDFHSPVISTIYYQAPEVILRIGWAQSCDTWGVGCSLFELYFGDLLFPTHEDIEHLAMMEKILGPIPSTMVNSTTRTKFFKNGALNFDWNKAEEDARNFCAPLKDFLRYDTVDDNEFFDIIAKMLEYEPTQRISMNESLKHPFFKRIPEHQRI